MLFFILIQNILTYIQYLFLISYFNKLNYLHQYKIIIFLLKSIFYESVKFGCNCKLKLAHIYLILISIISFKTQLNKVTSFYSYINKFLFKIVNFIFYNINFMFLY